MYKTKEWFGEWFDSPYYHVLYKNRDDQEAKAFIGQLINYLQLKKNDLIQDLVAPGFLQVGEQALNGAAGIRQEILESQLVEPVPVGSNLPGAVGIFVI